MMIYIAPRNHQIRHHQNELRPFAATEKDLYKLVEANIAAQVAKDNLYLGLKHESWQQPRLGLVCL
jgi:hypothetical protein